MDENNEMMEGISFLTLKWLGPDFARALSGGSPGPSRFPCSQTEKGIPLLSRAAHIERLDEQSTLHGVSLYWVSVWENNVLQSNKGRQPVQRVYSADTDTVVDVWREKRG